MLIFYDQQNIKNVSAMCVLLTEQYLVTDTKNISKTKVGIYNAWFIIHAHCMGYNT